MKQVFIYLIEGLVVLGLGAVFIFYSMKKKSKELKK
jgi:hypothetical protein